MIQQFYLSFANGLFRHIARPDSPYFQYYQDTNAWQYHIFTTLFLFMLGISILVTLIYYYYFNSKHMPAVYGTRKHWFFFMLIGAALNAVAVFIYLRSIQLAVGMSNHVYCTMLANAIFGIVAFFLASLLLKRWSNSAKTIPFRF